MKSMELNCWTNRRWNSVPGNALQPGRLGLFSPEKAWGDLIVAFQDLKEL